MQDIIFASHASLIFIGVFDKCGLPLPKAGEASKLNDTNF